MTIFRWIISALWLLFVLYWAIAALSTKRTVKTPAWWRQAGLRAFIIVLVLAAYRMPAVRHAVTIAQAPAGGIAWGAAGAILVGLGIGLAIVARAYLGRNWGSPMSQKENPELVTGGPYGLIRHPIYSGIILAMFGSMLGLSLLWLVPLVLFSAYFIYSARREEALMCRQFPGQYPAYMKRTKMLVPFLL
jgi:protein-S-isoprenylcysteine O-methyltransferase Ste14